MESNVRIKALTDIDKVIPLAKVAKGEGFQFLDRLIDEWNDGTNRFEQTGEAIFGAFIGDDLVGTGGLTIQRENVGRVRRVYVHPNHRKRGIASQLMVKILQRAQKHFSEVVLYTETDEAKRLYEGLGFIPEDSNGPDRATHRLRW